MKYLDVLGRRVAYDDQKQYLRISILWGSDQAGDVWGTIDKPITQNEVGRDLDSLVASCVNIVGMARRGLTLLEERHIATEYGLIVLEAPEIPAYVRGIEQQAAILRVVAEECAATSHPEEQRVKGYVNEVSRRLERQLSRRRL